MSWAPFGLKQQGASPVLVLAGSLVVQTGVWGQAEGLSLVWVPEVRRSAGTPEPGQAQGQEGRPQPGPQQGCPSQGLPCHPLQASPVSSRESSGLLAAQWPPPCPGALQLMTASLEAPPGERRRGHHIGAWGPLGLWAPC